MAIYVGPWDIMSQHYYKRKEPPVGTSSFTKIRLGWISSEQVVVVSPGNSAYAFLSPLSKKGKTLVVKIPLPQGHYYLIENRQQIGFDRILPDSGVLILKVNPHTTRPGLVRIMDADPDSPHFSHATFRLDKSNRTIFKDNENNIAVIPLWSEKENQGVLITSIKKSVDALNAALMIERLRKHFHQFGGKKANIFLEECVRTFKQFDFKRSYEIAQQAF